MAAQQPGARWHRVYYALALFDVLVVVLGLALNHRIVALFGRSVEVNQAWDRRLDDYLRLGDLAAAANAPGNDVFDSRDVAAEESRLRAAVGDFNGHLARLRDELPSSGAGGDDIARLSQDMDGVERALQEMAGEAGKIFAFFRAGRPDQAGSRMAEMDRKYRALTEALTRLRRDVSAIAGDLFREQRSLAASLHTGEYVLAAFVFVMIAGAVVYGGRIKRQFERYDAEREGHIEGLRRAETSLTQARDGLERKVRERTAELETTNAVLRAEVDERARAEARLKDYAVRLERSNRELQDFAHVASHDLQEPLRKVQAFGDRLLSRYAAALPEEGRDFVARMQAATGRMQTLINDLLVFSRVSTKAQPFAPVDLNEVAREVLEDLETRVQQKEARVEVGELPVLEADRTQMRQLLQNLVGNALKFHPPGSAPRVKVYGRPGEGEGEGRPRWQILVEDDGIGFEEKYLDRIFTVFQRLHGRNEYEGSGVGLAVCRKIVERHRGEITARSAPGRGATFVVTLPVTQSEKEEP